ncbi:MAG: molybdopterin converting factor subunit 1 [Candidatus Dormibacteraeota bacterium]|nr:molybdopterin converting factor subunit 1 [Candidatus Dormibacteraeota bacterium]
MKITALLFARLREQAGVDREDLDLPAMATVADAFARVREAHPGLEPSRAVVRAAVNREFASWEHRLAEGDEVAFIPPVSGGSGEVGVRFELTADPLDPRRLEAAVAWSGAGAICTFTGVVRDNSRGRPTQRLEYEAYAGMVESQMRAIASEIGARWPQARVAMAHRTGLLEIGEASVVVCVSAPHRGEAIAACQWGIDRLKETVPVWKKEFFEGGEVWIEGDAARSTD